MLNYLLLTVNVYLALTICQLVSNSRNFFLWGREEGKPTLGSESTIHYVVAELIRSLFICFLQFIPSSPWCPFRLASYHSWLHPVRAWLPLFILEMFSELLVSSSVVKAMSWKASEDSWTLFFLAKPSLRMFRLGVMGAVTVLEKALVFTVGYSRDSAVCWLEHKGAEFQVAVQRCPSKGEAWCE